MQPRLTDVIRKHLYGLYPEIKCFTDSAWQDDNGPAFLLEEISAPVRRRTAHGFYIESQYDLIYDPGGDTREPDKQCREMGWELSLALQEIPDVNGRVYQPDDIDATITDGILHMEFNIHCDYQIIKDAPDVTDIKVNLEREFN